MIGLKKIAQAAAEEIGFSSLAEDTAAVLSILAPVAEELARLEVDLRLQSIPQVRHCDAAWEMMVKKAEAERDDLKRQLAEAQKDTNFVLWLKKVAPKTMDTWIDNYAMREKEK